MQSEQLDWSEGVSHLFGYHEKINVQQKWLDAALSFTRLRKSIDQDRVKLQTLKPQDFHRSSKKKTFINSLVNSVAEGKTESLVLMPLLDAPDPGARVPALDLFVLGCFSLTAAHYQQLNSKGLVKIFPRLFSLTFQSVEFSSDMRNVFRGLVETSCGGSARGEQILQLFESLQESQTVASNGLMPALEPSPYRIPAATLFEYRGLDIGEVDAVLEQVCSNLRRSRQWRWERDEDSTAGSQITSCITACLPDDRDLDVNFVVRVAWDDGWNILSAHHFHHCITHSNGQRSI